MEKKRAKGQLLKVSLSFGRVSLVQKAILAKHLAVMLKSGLSITESLAIALDASEGKLKRVLEGVLKSVESGNTLASSLAQYPKVFSPFFINSVYAAETSGTLAESLDNVAEQMEKEKELISKIRGAMVYPLIILCASVALGAVLSFMVLPKIVPLFQGLKVDLPLPTRALISFSSFMERNGYIVLSALAIAAPLLFWLLRRSFMQPITHQFLIKAPIIRPISHNVNLARFCRTLGLLLKNGVVIDSALDITAETTRNYYYKRAVARVSREVRRGQQLSVSLEQSGALFPHLVTRMIKVGEESGRYEETLFYLANFYESEVDSATKSLSAVIEPILLLAMGLVVGFLAMAIIMPIYDITGRLGR